ncbi:MAG: DinB family protein [Candidatus Dormibacteria bacterium]
MVPPEGSSGTRPLTTDIGSWRPAEGDWCIKECIGHMIETEAHGFAGRIRRILAEPGLTERGWDQAQVQRDRQDHRRPLAALLDSFGEMRVESIQLQEYVLPSMGNSRGFVGR